MPCTPVSLPGGGHAIVCTGGRAKRCACGNRGVFLCDFKVPGKKTGTCDADLCGRCALSPAPDKHLCKPHAQAWAEWRRKKREAGADVIDPAL